jgi:hypothetical protein
VLAVNGVALQAPVVAQRKNAVLYRIDGKPINSFDDLIDMVGPSAGKLLTFTVDRGGDQVTLEVTPESTPQKSADGTMTQRGRIGLAPKRPEAIPANPIEAVRLGIRETYANLGQTVLTWDIITQRQSADQRAAHPRWPSHGPCRAGHRAFAQMDSTHFSQYRTAQFADSVLDGGRSVFTPSRPYAAACEPARAGN